PVIVLPLSQSQKGLPIGVQVVGRRGSDMRLIAIAETLTQITGGFQPPPGY
ncbi:MAG: amidase, partial [Moorea sp. SIO4G2]|nr:amidase [Moorena sp. SIO4G2]